MSDRTEKVKALIESLDESELRSLCQYLRSKLPRHPLEEKWNTSADVILDAIARSQDITQRGVRGVIAEAVFEAQVIPSLKGWGNVHFTGDLPYDFLIRSRHATERQIKIQVKLQRTVKGRPLNASRFYPPGTFIVEVQKTRSGAVRGPEAPRSANTSTRPYRFGEFDILAVSMHPSTGDWSQYMYTVASWLLPRTSQGEERLIQVMQPVSPVRTDTWTGSLQECIERLLSGERRTTFDLAALTTEYERSRQAERTARKLEREKLKAQRKAERQSLEKEGK